jgi:dolichol kinase
MQRESPPASAWPPARWPGWPSLLLAAAGVLALARSIAAAVRGGVLHLEGKRELKIWRLAARPFALLFIPLDLLWGRRVLLIVAGLLCLAFVALDVYRYVSRRRLAAMYKTSEAHRFSSMTCFLLSLFLGFLVFPDGVPYPPLAFSTIGDLCGKLVGMRFAVTPLHRDRTVQGTVEFLAGLLYEGWLLQRLLGCHWFSCSQALLSRLSWSCSPAGWMTTSRSNSSAEASWQHSGTSSASELAAVSSPRWPRRCPFPA